MAEATQEMIALAREIACEQWPSAHDFPEREAAEAAALAAIQATTERAAKFASWAHMVPPDGGSPTEEECDLAASIAEGLRAAAHLKEQSA